VYAAHEGVVDRVHRSAEDEGGVTVWLTHFGGAVTTEYAHLAAVPRRLIPGVRIAAGDVIGLAGDNGVDRARMPLYFALSVRPSTLLPEVFWDPTPLMVHWPLVTPTRGSVAGLSSPSAAAEHEAGEPLPHKRIAGR